MINKLNKPSINLYYSNKLDESDFKILLNGIEEEGIPYELKSQEQEDVLCLSHDACIDSILGVGIGVNSSEIALQYNKLNKESPLFKIEINSRKNVVRALGSNAARLVKRMPFKEM